MTDSGADGNESKEAEDGVSEESRAEEPRAEEPQAEEPRAEEPRAAPPAAAAAAATSLGYLVEFETEEALMSGAARVRDAGYAHWDSHTPYAVHGLDAAMGMRPTILPWIVLVGGLTGCAAGLFLQLYTNGIQLPFSLSDNPILDPFVPSGYPFVTSGKPIFSVPANIPVTFELTILLSAFAAFFSVWGLSMLPRFHHPVFTSERFKRATQDRFFISIEARDALYDREQTGALASSLGGSFVEELLGEGH